MSKRSYPLLSIMSLNSSAPTLFANGPPTVDTTRQMKMLQHRLLRKDEAGKIKEKRLRGYPTAQKFGRFIQLPEGGKHLSNVSSMMLSVTACQ